MNPNRQWTRGEENLLMHLYREGVALRKIANIMSREYNDVRIKNSNLLRQLGIPARNRNLKQASYEIEADKDLIIELSASGMSARDIAKKFGYSRWLVSDRLKKWGVEDPEVDLSLFDLPSVKLSDFYQGGWADVNSKMLIKVNKVPRFLIIPIEEVELKCHAQANQ